MKKPRAPYAKRSVWTAIAVLSVVLVAGLAIVGYEINHLNNEVNGLQNQVSSLLQALAAIGTEGPIGRQPSHSPTSPAA